MNLPNKLSIVRIAMVPLFVIAYFLPADWACGPYVAIAIFILAAFTDFLDGYIARKHNLVTDLGKLLDPIADKILVCAALFCITASNPLRCLIGDPFDPFVEGRIILAVGGALVLARELLIDAVRMIAASKGKVVQANLFGKIKTVLLDVSLPVLFLAEGLCVHLSMMSLVSSYTKFEQLRDATLAISYVGLILFALAVVMAVVSGVVYLVQNKKVFSEEK